MFSSSFPDFRLVAAVKNKDGVALCENCCETITSLCVPSEPERVPGKGDTCLLLGVEKHTGISFLVAKKLNSVVRLLLNKYPNVK